MLCDREEESNDSLGPGTVGVASYQPARPYLRRPEDGALYKSGWICLAAEGIFACVDPVVVGLMGDDENLSASDPLLTIEIDDGTSVAECLGVARVRFVVKVSS